MIQSTPHPSSPHGSDSSNATQYMPNTGMYMGQFPWPQPACIPYPGHAPAHPYYPYSVPLNGTHGAPPSYAPVAHSPGVGAGVAHHVFQTGQNGYCPCAVTNVSLVTYVGPYLPPTAAALPPQGPPAPPLYHQPFLSFPAAANPCASPIPHQRYLHQHNGTGLVTDSASQAPSVSLIQRHMAEYLHHRYIKQTKIGSGGIKNDPLFKPVLNRLGEPNGSYVCSKDGMLLRSPASYFKHIRTQRHLGFKLQKFKCPGCSKAYTTSDSYKKHLENGNCEQSTDVGALPLYPTAEEEKDDDEGPEY
ncbi:uncharacterized protein F5147DRAFT_331674 [Suillus discolor]|uniref:C2H2-type domain-containing protein n=1 Tax=Suillus discolor TaxID=1912936 RepID=A0A9P7F0T2_9AGAM|nr:uncharacterized protein F5147DRAFT_331674 [Suillus discolor]KAG2099825.1 hypothetical protein F5147DRAFT_331674 [Suillus discolor]